jgi:hypothetical protein
MKAFPTTIDNEGYQIDHQGMDLRDYFAAKAMQGLLSSPNSDKEVNVSLICAYSYTFAEEMMKARKE